jgi:flagellar FliL protein
MSDKEQKSPGQKKRSKIPIILIVVVVLAVNGLIVGKIFLGGKSKGGHKETTEVGQKLALEEFLVNLGDAGSEHYLKTTIALGLKKGIDGKSLEEEQAPIKDTIISVLSSSKRDEISTEEGKQELKEEIKTRVNKALKGEKVLEVYFTAFATQ